MKRLLTQEEIREKRRKANEDLLRRVDAGEVTQGNSQASWWPDRPIIKKDVELMKKLYDNDDDNNDEEGEEKDGKY